MMKTFLATIAVAALLSTPAAGQVDLTGKWEITSETPRGINVQTVTLQQDGSIVTGSMEGTGGGGRGGGGGARGGRGFGGPVEIQDGSVDGDTFTFLTTRGRGDRVFELVYSGTISGDTIAGTMTTPRGESEFTMVRVES